MHGLSYFGVLTDFLKLAANHQFPVFVTNQAAVDVSGLRLRGKQEVVCVCFQPQKRMRYEVSGPEKENKKGGRRIIVMYIYI